MNQIEKIFFYRKLKILRSSHIIIEGIKVKLFKIQIPKIGDQKILNTLRNIKESTDYYYQVCGWFNDYVTVVVFHKATYFKDKEPWEIFTARNAVFDRLMEIE